MHEHRTRLVAVLLVLPVQHSPVGVQINTSAAALDGGGGWIRIDCGVFSFPSGALL